MALQKYHTHRPHLVACDNGAIMVYGSTMHGRHLALIRDCPTSVANIPPRTVYITGECDSFFSQPAAIMFRNVRINGFVSMDDGSPVFRPTLY
jgi:hypothetical protein